MPDSENLPNKSRKAATQRDRAMQYGAVPPPAERSPQRRNSFAARRLSDSPIGGTASHRRTASESLASQTSLDRSRRRRARSGNASVRESASPRFDLWSALFGRRSQRPARPSSSRPSKEIALQRLAQSTRQPAREQPREVLQSVFSTERIKRFEPIDRKHDRFSRQEEPLPPIAQASRFPVRGEVKGFTSRSHRQRNGVQRLPSASEQLRSPRGRGDAKQFPRLGDRPSTVLQFNDGAVGAEGGRLPAGSSRQNRRRRMEVISNDSPTRLESGSAATLRQRTAPSTRRRDARPARLPRSVTAVVYAMRMVILSVGVGVLAGTTLSVWDPASRAPAGASQQAAQSGAKSDAANKSSAPSAATQASVNLGQEMMALKTSVQAIVTKNTAQSPQLAPGVFLLDLDTNAYLDLNGEASVAAASIIKIPVLIAFFQDVDAGKIRLDEPLTMRKELVATGSGDMQYQAVGTQFSALETATKMITTSDNTATNMLIARLGGLATLNRRIKSWGLTSTTLNNLLPDLEGTNATSPKEMALLLARLSQGDLVSMRSRDRILEIMRQTENDSMLPQGLDEGATIAHKTGTIGLMLGDVGLIDLPNGKRYIAAVLVKRSANDEQAQTLIQQISQVSYQYFNHSLEAQNVPADSALPESPDELPVPKADNDGPKNLDGTPIDPSSTAQAQQRAR